jgi:phage-related minor tail protein
MSNMNAAISNFVETGKFEFGDFTASVIKDIIRMEMQAQAAMLFRMMLGSIGGFSFSKVNYGAGVAPIQPGLAAAGGEIDGPTIVGENGPELFIPSRRGTVIPNTIAPSMASMSQPQVVYNGPYIENMSAIDTQSAAQFLSKNKMSVWAANKSADRSVPVSR